MIKTVFLSGTQELQCYCNHNNEIYIQIEDLDAAAFNTQYVALDIPTAIKLAKVLRAEINLAKG